MATRFFANASVTNPTVDVGTTRKGARNDSSGFPEWLIYQTATATRPTQSNSYVYVSGPDESTQTFYVAIAMSNLVGGGGTPPAIGWPDVAFYGCLTGDTDAVKIAVMNQACAGISSRAEVQGNEDLQDELITAGFPFSTGGLARTAYRALNGDASAGAAGIAGAKCPIIIFENGVIP